MGACCSKEGAQLPAATAEEIERIRSAGHLPVVATPAVDFHGKNQLQTVYIAQYENGAEITLLFLDEDRPNMCEDCLYDTIRRPLFGRYSDVGEYTSSCNLGVGEIGSYTLYPLTQTTRSRSSTIC